MKRGARGARGSERRRRRTCWDAGGARGDRRAALEHGNGRGASARRSTRSSWSPLRAPPPVATPAPEAAPAAPGRGAGTDQTSAEAGQAHPGETQTARPQAARADRAESADQPAHRPAARRDAEHGQRCRDGEHTRPAVSLSRDTCGTSWRRCTGGGSVPWATRRSRRGEFSDPPRRHGSGDPAYPAIRQLLV